MFAKVNGTSGVDHLEDIVAVHGKALGPETKPDGSGRTTSAYVEFKSVDACNAAFKALRGAQGTDALGRPQKSVKMVVTNERPGRTSGTEEARRGAETEAAKMPNFSKTTVVELRKALAKRGLSEEGLKPALVERLREAMEKEAGGGGGAKGGDAKTKTAAEKVSPIPANVSRLTVAELRKALEARGLATDGLKAALVARLEEARDAAGEDSEEDADDDEEAAVTRTVMVRKMAAHQGRAIGAKDKNAGGDAGTPRTGEKRKPGAAAGGSADAKKPRRVPRPSRRARLAAKGIYE
jgi:RNA exonuclease 1